MLKNMDFIIVFAKNVWANNIVTREYIEHIPTGTQDIA